MELEGNVRIYRWEEMPKEPVTDLVRRRYVAGERTMVAQIFLDKGSVVPTHAHENEQISYLLSGALRFWITGEGGTQELLQRTGDVLIIPPNVPHKAEALEDTLSLDIFTPPRSDWLDGTDTYFHRAE